MGPGKQQPLLTRYALAACGYYSFQYGFIQVWPFLPILLGN